MPERTLMSLHRPKASLTLPSSNHPDEIDSSLCKSEVINIHRLTHSSSNNWSDFYIQLLEDSKGLHERIGYSHPRFEPEMECKDDLSTTTYATFEANIYICEECLYSI